jgi:hypothetical protein
MALKYEHVKAHQDNLKPWSMLLLVEQLNVICDKLAKGAVLRYLSLNVKHYLIKLPIFYIKIFITTYIQGQTIFCLSFPPCRQSNRTRVI